MAQKNQVRMTAPKMIRKPSGKAKVRHMSIRRADNGGYMVDQDSSAPGEYEPGTTHVFGSAADMHAHVKKHMNDGDDAPAPKRANRQEPGEQAG